MQHCGEVVMNLKNQQGSALIEIIVSMFILTLLCMGLNASVVNLMQNNIASRQMVVATAEGDALLETLRLANYDSVATGSDVVRDRFKRSWTVNEDGTEKKIDLTVSWPLPTTRHSITLSTIISKP
jgi:Tfp pilus assembly protein PilV